MEHVGQDHHVKDAIVPGHSGALIRGDGNEFSFPSDTLNTLDADSGKGIHQGATEVTESTARIEHTVARLQVRPDHPHKNVLAMGINRSVKAPEQRPDHAISLLD